MKLTPVDHKLLRQLYDRNGCYLMPTERRRALEAAGLIERRPGSPPGFYVLSLAGVAIARRINKANGSSKRDPSDPARSV